MCIIASANVLHLLCSLYNNIRTPGQLQPSATFYLFKEGIEPKWEDPKNTNGGCWTASIPPPPRNVGAKSQLDAYWLSAVSCRSRMCVSVSITSAGCEPAAAYVQVLSAYRAVCGRSRMLACCPGQQAVHANTGRADNRMSARMSGH